MGVEELRSWELVEPPRIPPLFEATSRFDLFASQDVSEIDVRDPMGGAEADHQREHRNGDAANRQRIERLHQERADRSGPHPRQAAGPVRRCSCVPTTSRLWASRTGSGLMSTADNADHVTAAAPIAAASVAMEASVDAGRFSSRRSASRSSSISGFPSALRWLFASFTHHGDPADELLVQHPHLREGSFVHRVHFSARVCV